MTSPNNNKFMTAKDIKEIRKNVLAAKTKMTNAKSDPKVLQSASVGNSDFSLVESEGKFRVMKEQNGSSATLSVSRDKAASEADFNSQVRMAEDFQ